MTSMWNKVFNFQLKYGHPAEYTPTLKSVDMEKRLTLIAEEVGELADASGVGYDGDTYEQDPDLKQNMVGIVDALGDILYLVIGTFVELGVDHEPIFNAIHESNMSKNQPSRPQGKPIKGANYFKPNIAKELIKQGWIP